MGESSELDTDPSSHCLLDVDLLYLQYLQGCMKLILCPSLETAEYTSLLVQCIVLLKPAIQSDLISLSSRTPF